MDNGPKSKIRRPLPYRLDRRAVLPGIFTFFCLGNLSAATANDPLEDLIADLSRQLDPRAASALSAMPDLPRRLLAARAYFRMGSGIPERWSWNQDELAAFEASPAKVTLDAAVERVRDRFAATNPGYSLFVNPTFRNFEVQLVRWNENDSVARAGEDLLHALRQALQSPEFPPVGSPDARRRLSTLMRSHRPQPSASLAAPGLSRHGRLSAIDFQVAKAGQIVAGARVDSVSTDWDAAGWTSRLKSAVADAATGFEGPLTDPYEPWHYDFRPRR